MTTPEAALRHLAQEHSRDSLHVYDEALDVERLRQAMDVVVPESIPPLYWTNERLAVAIAHEYAALTPVVETTDHEHLLMYDASYRMGWERARAVTETTDLRERCPFDCDACTAEAEDAASGSEDAR